jgi:hypothetical protein
MKGRLVEPLFERRDLVQPALVPAAQDDAAVGPPAVTASGPANWP